MKRTPRPLITPGVLLGMSWAGLADGIVLHQILQWHHMICSTRTCHPLSMDDLRRMDRTDGYFHLSVWALTMLATALLFRAGQRENVLWSGRVFAGALLAGAGLFNLVEGVIDHHMLQIHHVRPGPTQGAWDVGFLLISALLLAVGAAIVRAGTAGPRG